jgi:cell fate regulator YaaT (PSP1 superfamily)
MPGSISLPQVVLDLEEEDRQKYAALSAPKAIVVRYGYMKLVGEFPYDGDAKPGCGSKLVVRTQRGVELGEMLTTTCSNGGCGKSVSRKDMLQYIENSGGKDYPFSTQGRVVRIATIEDLKQQEVLDAGKMDMIRFAKRAIADANLPMKLVEVEPLLGGDRIIFHFASEEWVDFRELVGVLAHEFRTRIELHQVNARDEARLVADYEKCGQHCCCKQFLKVLKPVSMKSAKVQKATLDPTKISGRCGRLMCCLRYEDETYDSLKKNLPHRQTRVITEEGPGTVLDTQILTQLVLIALDSEYNAPKAFPVEHIRPMTKEEIALHKVTQPLPPQQQQQRPPSPAPAPGNAPGNKPRPRK